jgi:Carboxypeptidase regulatory-like domain
MFSEVTGNKTPFRALAAADLALFALLALLGSLIGSRIVSAMPEGSQLAGESAGAGNHDQVLSVVVLDENAVPVSAAHVQWEDSTGNSGQPCETDFAGRCEFSSLATGLYLLRVTKEGFYAFTEKNIEVGKVESVQVTLNHQRESLESINVTYSPPVIDLKQTTASESLTSQEIVELPYTVSRDIRYALRMLPGVVQDGTGQVHVAGSDTRQTRDQLDGFDINAPVSGLLTLRVSVDAVRAIKVESSRSAAEFGKGSGGFLSLRTGMGDDRFRYSATDVIPSLQSRKGIHLNNWAPRGTITGPLRKGKAWFLLAPEGEYDLDFIQELPSDADRSTVIRYGNLARIHVNLTDGNILTGGYLINRFRSYNAGLSRFDPIETTLNLRQTADFLTLKDQIILSNGGLVEFGIAKSRFTSRFHPKGNETYVISPEQTTGNFFESGDGRSNRFQGMINWYLPPARWSGRHDIKLGTDLNRLTFHQSFERNPFEIVRADSTLARRVTFSTAQPYGRDNFEVSGYGEDHWIVSDRLVVEPGVRFDWDQIVRDVLISPRFATSYLLTTDGNTKLTAGAGIYYDASNLDFATRSLGGERTDFFFAEDGQTMSRLPAETSYVIRDRDLKGQRTFNWSLGVERKLPRAVYLHLEFLEKRGHHGWAFLNPNFATPGLLGGELELQPLKSDRYDSFEVAARKAFANDHYVFASYTLSSARSNAVLDFPLENPIFARQAGGSLPWDSPNRFISWGWLPLRGKYNASYFMEWRSGYPFSVVNENQELVGLPGSRRFPAYFSVNMAVERRVIFLGFQWALRVGFNDITNHANPTVVNNNIDSPRFPSFGGLEGRSLVARIRFLGEK